MANATLEFFEMFPMADGTNYPYKNGVYNGPNPDNVDIFVNRDPRLYETMMITRENEPFAALSSIQLWQGGNAQNTDGMYNDTNGDRFKSGFPLYKWVLDYSEGLPRTHNLSYSYIRMADMHLMYAEALAETGNLAKALEEVNKVRARVGLRNIETANPGLNLTSNKENLIDEILRERACEFALEDERLFDIIRRKEIEKFTSPLHEMVFWRKTADGGKDLRKNTLLAEGEAWPDFIYETRQIQINLRSWWSGGWSNKYLLSPFPRDEVNKGYGLTQNPGW